MFVFVVCVYLEMCNYTLKQVDTMTLARTEVPGNVKNAEGTKWQWKGRRVTR